MTPSGDDQGVRPGGVPHDPRGVANLLLDRTALFDVQVTNLTLQKLLYFAHGRCLTMHGRPLLIGHFEAWRYGPVHPLTYAAFKDCGPHAITRRATRFNLAAGIEEVVSPPDDDLARELVDAVLATMGRLSAGRLVEISHVPGGPWDFIVNKARTTGALGLRIPDKIIRERFARPVSVQSVSPCGEPVEDTPLT